jgi:hypothetical protein
MPDIITQIPVHLHLRIQMLIHSLEKYGITHVDHEIIMEGLTSKATYSHEAWAKKYKDEELFKIDPLRRYALNTPFEMISWEDILIQNVQEKYAFEERKRLCSVNHGVLLALRKPNYLETFVFGSDYYKFDFEQIYRKQTREIFGIMNSMGNIHKTVNSQHKLADTLKIAS